MGDTRRDPESALLRLVGADAGRFAASEESPSGFQRAAARARQTQLSSAFELARLGPWEYDVESDLFTFNDYFYAIFRTTAEREGGYTMSSARYAERFVHPDDRHLVGVEIRRALEATTPNHTARLEHRIVRADGDVGHISVAIVIVKDERGRTVKTYGVNQDITERVRGKRALEEAHAQLRVLHENVEDALFSIDVPHRRVLYASPGHERVFGYPAQAFFQNPMLWYDLVVPDDKRLIETGSLVLRRGERLRLPFRIVRADGQVRWVEARVKATLDRDGGVDRIDGIASDITERVNAAEKRSQLEAQLRQVQRVESLGTLAGGIAHDFNNILNIIVGYTAILSASRENPTVVSRALDAISRATARGTALVNQLLTFARATDVSYESVDIHEIVLELAKLFEQTFPKTITTDIHVSEDLPLVYGSAPQIHQLLLNLAINSRDAMPEGGVLSICADRVPGERVKERFPTATAPEYVRIRVRDTGVGMTEATRQRIFEPFFTTKGPGKGTGLGLAVAFGIVEAHRGHITVESVPGCGALFTVYLRLSEQRAPSEPRPLPESGIGIEGTETILVVEDEDLLRSMLKSVLESHGYTVLTAENGSTGVHAFETHPEIAAVVSDLGLPEMTGAEVVRRIRARDEHVKCIITSGFMTAETAAELQRAGVNRTVQKPFEPTDLIRALRSLLDSPGAVSL